MKTSSNFTSSEIEIKELEDSTLNSRLDNVNTALKRCFYIIYESLLKDISSQTIVQDYVSSREIILDASVCDTIEYFEANKEMFYQEINQNSHNKPAKHIPKADLAIILAALALLRFGDKDAVNEMSKKSALSDSIELAKLFGSKDETYRFVQAILTNIISF